jgi:dephospho-CoA kinase
MLIVGLTGGIGSGKSTVTELFANLGVPIIDADIVARQVVEPGQPALKEIINNFSPKIIGEDGHLDRTQLRQIIFDDPTKRKTLEALLHPRIRQAIQQQLAQLPETTPYCILSVPLLFESGQYSFINRTLVIDIDEQLQIARTCQRDDIPLAQAERIIEAQMPRQQRLSQADDIILNDGDREQLKIQVSALHQKFLILANQQR